MSAPIGYFVTADEAQCAACHRPDEWDGFEDWEAPPPIYYGTEGDSPTHCHSCGELIPHALTDEGQIYVASALAHRDGEPDVLAAWASAYESDLDEVAPDPQIRAAIGRLDALSSPTSQTSPPETPAAEL